ncbi:hypothetical protein EUX98_g1741 [Antrodiella citrinella]|uniref:Uncharacterized protein n=1 Tax=Antrodiella citrinella TaxID=2447956 RepID=A0A4S4N0R9_9APHY|nr:hypothetical protein EUX98_g1741 [Antrodiella citrinella]
MPSRFAEDVLSPRYQLRSTSEVKHTGVALTLNHSKLVPGICIFPVEVLEEIILAVLVPKRVFSSIANFSLASYQFRQIAFRNFFKTFCASSIDQWTNLRKVPGVVSWARSLESVSIVVFSQLDNLAAFTNFSSVEIDMSPEGLSTQHTFIKYLFKHLPAGLLHLTLSFLPRVDTALLSRISEKFLNLQTLQLTCTERLVDDCCWDCYEEASTCTVHSPIPDVYVDAEDLSYAFGTALVPLTKLTTLHLGIFLSELDIFQYHLYDCRCITFQTLIGPAVMGTSSFGGPDSCPQCFELFSKNVRATELFASACIARTLPALETISWSSFFAEDNPGDDQDNLTTTAWVLRKDGKVKVRRAPWC